MQAAMCLGLWYLTSGFTSGLLGVSSSVCLLLQLRRSAAFRAI